MTERDQFIGLEERFWTEGGEFFRHHLAPDATMVLPDPVGILDAEATIATLEAAPRWETVEMSDIRYTEPSVGVVILAYRATARREDQTFTASCSSTYVRVGEGYRLVCHQQTPGG